MKIISVNSLDSTRSGPVKQVLAQPSTTFTPTETRLAEIWQEVLGIYPATVQSNFFELGGNSLTATQMVARIRNLFEVNFPLQDFFLGPTLAEMASKLELLTERRSALFVPPKITPVSRDLTLPLSFSQERMWFVHQLDPANTAYNVVGAMRLRGEFNQSLMQRSLNELIKRHESLRTTFPALQGQPVQRIAPGLEVTFDRFDLSDCPAPEREVEITRVLVTEASRPFDIETGPLVRVAVVFAGPGEHVLLLNMHHLITDGWSMSIFGQELLEIYKALVTGSTPNLPALQIQFADYAYWQRQWFQGEVYDAHLNYWRRQLNGVTPLNLPTDHPRPPIQTYNGSFVVTRFDDELLEGVQRLANATGSTPFMVELAAFQVLLYRYSGQTDIVVGTPLANRDWVQSETLIGSLVTTLPMRVNLDGQPTFRDFLQQVRQVALDAYTYQNIPFATLVTQLNPTRDISYSPLAQVMFNVINVPAPTWELPGLEIEQIEVDRLGTQFDLSFYLLDMPSLHNIRVEFNVDLFERSTIERLLEHYLELLRAIVFNPDQTVDTLSMLSIAEKQFLVEDLNATAQPFDPSQTLVQIFESQVEKTPQAPALFFDDTQASYSQLNSQVNRLANYLIEKGIKAASRIGICLPRSYDAVVAILAILKAGATYVPLDPSYPLSRLDFMIHDAALALVITKGETTELVGKICPAEVPLIDLEAAKDEIAARRSENLPGLSRADIPAYVSYTSGSTGQPKGVMATHYGVLNRAAWMWRVYPFETGEVLCHKTSLNFVDSVWEIFGPLLRGFPAVILPDGFVKDPDLLVKTLASYRVSRLTLVPSLLKVLLETHPQLGEELPALRLVISSGEVLPAPLAQRFRAQFPRVCLLNLYGSSEASGDSTYYEVGDDSPADFIPIGKPMDNVQLYVLDPHLQLMPFGIPGELYIGGTGLALGYLNRPDMTEARFVPDPFSSGERLYRTGDWVRYLPDGNLQYLGRQDDQVKIRGMRIALGEVEAGLKRHPAVAAAAVIVRQDQSGNNQLVAFVLPGDTNDGKVTAKDIQLFLATHLPGHMVPARLEILEQFPLMPNGKLDKQALARLVSNLKPGTEKHSEPRDALEKRLLEIWRNLLEHPESGMEDDFFALGGHSLLAVRLFAEIEKEFAVKLPLAILFQAPTPSGLAQSIRDLSTQAAQGAEVKRSPLVPLQTKGSKLPFYCIHAVGGGALYYSAMARYLGDDQPFYGIQALQSESQAEHYASIETIARYYIEAIKEVQPEGPYYMGGYSLGGSIAYEMARHLTAAGEKIGLLAAFDHPAPGGGYEIPHFNLTFFRGLVKNFPHWAKDFFHPRARGRLGRVWKKIEPFIYVRRAKTPGEGILNFVEKDIVKAPAEFQELMRLLYRAGINYKPKPYKGKITVFRAIRQPLVCSYDPHMAWDNLVDSVEIYHVPGDHNKLMVEPWVQGTAAALKTALEANQP